MNRDAILVVAVELERRPCAVAHRDHAAALVRHQEPAGREGAAFIPHDRVVETGAVDIALQHRAARVVLRDQVGAIVQEPGGTAAFAHLIQPPERVVRECRAAGAGDQQVLRAVAERVGTRGGKVAARVIGQQLTVRGPVASLVQAVSTPGAVSAPVRTSMVNWRARQGSNKVAVSTGVFGYPARIASRNSASPAPGLANQCGPETRLPPRPGPDH